MTPKSRTNPLRRVVGLAAAIVLSSSPARAQQVEQHIECAGASTTPVELSYGAHTTLCTLASGAERHNFFFMGEEGDLVRFRVRSYTEGFDPMIEVYEPPPSWTPIELTPNGCDGGTAGRSGANACSLDTDLRLPVTGVYSVRMRDDNDYENGSYILSLHRLEAPEEGLALRYGMLARDAVDPPTDIDHFSIEALAGTKIEVVVRSKTLGLDPRVEVLGPVGDLGYVRLVDPDHEPARCNGQTYGHSGVNECSIAPSYNVIEDGLHTIMVFDDIEYGEWSYKPRGESGSFDITVNCLLGFCPDFRPPVFDDFSLYSIQTDDTGVVSGETKYFRVRAPGGGSSDAWIASVTGDHVVSTGIEQDGDRKVWVVRTSGAPAGTLLAKARLPAVGPGDTSLAGSIASYFQSQSLAGAATSFNAASGSDECPLNVRLVARNEAGAESYSSPFSVHSSFAELTFFAEDFLDVIDGPQVVGTLADYGIGVNLYASCDGVPGELRIAESAIGDATSPVNDLAENALEIRDGIVGGSLTGATRDGTTWLDGATLTEADVWYRYRARGTGKLRLHTCGTNAARLNATYFSNTLLSVHSQAPGSSSHQLAANDDWASGAVEPEECLGNPDTGMDSALEHDVVAGQEVYVRVSRSAPGSLGPFAMTVVPEPTSGLAGGAALLALAALGRRRGRRR